MNQDLTELLDKKQKQALTNGGAIDWNDRRDKFIDAVQILYRQIETILAEPIAKNIVAVQRRAKDLTEDYIGTYSIEDLIVLIGEEQVRFSPRGRNTAGASGRVDVLGERGEVSLLVQPGPRWGFVQSRQPTLRVIPFDESSFAEVLKLVMRD